MLSGKTALVTGGSKGIGYAVALSLVQVNCQVVIASRDAVALSKACSEIQTITNKPELIKAIPCDVSKKENVDTLFAEILQVYGVLDVVINNAGIALTGPIAKLSLESFDKIMGINLRGAYIVMSKAAKIMSQRGAGHIVNIGSVASKQTFPDWGIYCASKFGLLALTKTLSQEMRTKGVKVTSVLPGAVDTPLWDDTNMNVSREFMLKPDDVAQSVLFCLTQGENTSIDELELTSQLGLL